MEGRKNTMATKLLLSCFGVFFSGVGIRTNDKHLSTKSNSPASIYFLIFRIDPGAGCRTLQSTKPLSFPENAQKSETAAITKVVFAKTGF